jgi:hypothetical protein
MLVRLAVRASHGAGSTAIPICCLPAASAATILSAPFDCGLLSTPSRCHSVCWSFACCVSACAVAIASPEARKYGSRKGKGGSGTPRRSASPSAPGGIAHSGAGGGGRPLSARAHAAVASPPARRGSSAGFGGMLSPGGSEAGFPVGLPAAPAPGSARRGSSGGLLGAGIAPPTPGGTTPKPHLSGHRGSSAGLVGHGAAAPTPASARQVRFTGPRTAASSPAHIVGGGAGARPVQAAAAPPAPIVWPSGPDPGALSFGGGGRPSDTHPLDAASPAGLQHAALDARLQRQRLAQRGRDSSGIKAHLMWGSEPGSGAAASGAGVESSSPPQRHSLRQQRLEREAAAAARQAAPPADAPSASASAVVGRISPTRTVAGAGGRERQVTSRLFTPRDRPEADPRNYRHLPPAWTAAIPPAGRPSAADDRDESFYSEAGAPASPAAAAAAGSAGHSAAVAGSSPLRPHAPRGSADRYRSASPSGLERQQPYPLGPVPVARRDHVACLLDQFG